MKSRSFNVLVVFALFLSLLGGALTVTPARAASIVVNTNADNTATDGLCTLREAITNANNDAATYPDCTAGAGADTITFAADYTITLAGSQLPTITSQMTITGNGATKSILQASTCNPVTLPGGCTAATYRVLEVNNTGNLTLDSLTVRYGNCMSTCATNVGGGIYNSGTITITNVAFSSNKANTGGGMYTNANTLLLTNVTFSGNSAGGAGGMFINAGSPTLTNVTFSGNSATYIGGGMLINGGSPTLTNVTFNGNSANSAGGMWINAGSPTLTNVTFSANSANSEGGGMYNFAGSPTLTNVTFSGNSASNGGGMFNLVAGSPTLTNVTFSGNSASNGGGMWNMGGSNTLKNVIIANSTGGNCFFNSSPIVSSTNNLIDDSSCGLSDGTDGNKIGASYNVNLGALADNGGFTQTMSLLTGSDAIDAGANCAATDQRGVTRPQGAGCDIGAYEAGAIIPVVTASNPSANAVLTSLSSITVVFNQDMLDNATSDGAENINNYILVERGANGSFDTTSCKDGVVSDDVQQTISSASYNSAGFITSLTLASPLTAGTYRLFVCGTTSIWSAAGLELNNGASDTTVDFTIGAATATSTRTGKTDASSLPKTGFAPSKVTSLPAQPATLAYASLGDLWLEIPSLNVKSTIVGVPQNADKSWDVTWLGNDTGWLNGTAFPTWTGNSVLTAHVTNASGVEGPFAALKSLKYGDQVIVHMGGAQYVYEVRNSRLVRPYATSFAFEALKDHSYLTLITCQFYMPNSDTYLFRRIVRAVLMEVK